MHSHGDPKSTRRSMQCSMIRVINTCLLTLLATQHLVHAFSRNMRDTEKYLVHWDSAIGTNSWLALNSVQISTLWPYLQCVISYVAVIVTVLVLGICKLCRWRGLFSSGYQTRDVKLGRSFQCISLNILLVGKKFQMKFVALIEKYVYIICLVGTNHFLPDEPFWAKI